MKKIFMVALFTAGLAAGCGDEDGLSPGARLDAAEDTLTDAPVKKDTMSPGADGSSSEDAPVNMDAPAAMNPDGGVDGSPADGARADAEVPDADLGDAGDGGQDAM